MSDTTSETRPSIPADIRRRVLVEAGHRCAIPTCRHIDVDVHHIVPWSKSRNHDYDNLIALCPNCHRRADRGDIDRKSLRLYKHNLRFAHDKFSQFELDLLFEIRDGSTISLPSYMHLQIKRLEDAGYVDTSRDYGAVELLGLTIQPESISITKKGLQFIRDIGLREI